MLTEQLKEHIRELRAYGVPYAKIAAHLELNANSVKTYCLRNHITTNPDLETVTDPTGIWCLHCCARTRLRKGSRFCCTECRRAWWKTHRTPRTTIITCTGCQSEATVTEGCKYCSHACFIRHRFKTRGGKY